jgi:hypothetical protein
VLSDATISFSVQPFLVENAFSEFSQKSQFLEKVQCHGTEV